MFYHCTKYQFALPAPNPGIVGGVIAASAMPRMALMRRQKKLLKEYPWLAHRFFDPQLYLSEIAATSKAVPNLATWPWFGVQNPQFNSAEHKRVKDWMKKHTPELKRGWQDKSIHEESAIENAVKTAVDMQLSLGVEAIILPAPLTTKPAEKYARECKYIDAGLDYVKLRKANCSDLRDCRN